MKRVMFRLRNKYNDTNRFVDNVKASTFYFKIKNKEIIYIYYNNLFKNGNNNDFIGFCIAYKSI